MGLLYWSRPAMTRTEDNPIHGLPMGHPTATSAQAVVADSLLVLFSSAPPRERRGGVICV